MPAPRKPRARKSSTARKIPAAVPTVADISFDSGICHDLAAAEQREWLVTNGIGGFASGTVAGSATRRYHGLLVAALIPPLGRTLLVGGFDEIATANGNLYSLATHRWISGAVAPQGYLTIENFRLDGATPVWTYLAGNARLEKRIWMCHGENTTFIQYTLLQSSSPIKLQLKALVDYRDFHSSTHAGAPPNEWRMRIDPVENGVCVTAYDGAVPFYLRCVGAACEPPHVWYRDFFFPRENERGLEDHEDQLFAADFHARLEPGQTLTLVVSTEKETSLDGQRSQKEESAREDAILFAAQPLLAPRSGEGTPSWLPRLVLAADQFVVRRTVLGQNSVGKTVIAGYHWFGDWGRDTMITLPGLALATGRPDVAREILLAFSHFVDGGMLPNTFPNSGAAPEYNTIDATLWYFEAIRQYFAATQDSATLKELFPVLAQIVAEHVKGTRYNIHVDPADGLLYGGGPGVQLTWMDAKIGDWVVTPRTGKPVEINALWINALESMSQFAVTLGLAADEYQKLSLTAKSSFSKFWNPQRNCCFDVIDAPRIGNDASLRPNQIFAVSLPVSPLTDEQQRAVVESCATQLLTPFGLRSLALGEPGYVGVYAGGVRERDGAYHQGPVWGWLLGPFALAHYRVYRDPTAALAFLDPLARSIDSYGLGTLAEIFDGDPPHRPRGCIAQAWSVSGILGAYKELFT